MVQWNVPKQDTFETEESVLTSEMSQFQGLTNRVFGTVTYYVLFTEVSSFQGVLIKRVYIDNHVKPYAKITPHFVHVRIACGQAVMSVVKIET